MEISELARGRTLFIDVSQWPVPAWPTSVHTGSYPGSDDVLSLIVAEVLLRLL